jgi:iron complex transport system permease protein
LTTLVAVFHEELKTLVIWQMGSFSMKGWLELRLFLPFFIVGSIGLFRFTRELDLLSFGDEEAKAAGVETEKTKKLLFMFGAILAGSSVALSGAISFVDLIAPHISRKIVGASHRYVLPQSFLVGGMIMTASDLAARTILSPSELPVGAVTAIIGAPFFVWVYFRRRDYA